jgi:ribosomal protein S5
VVKGGKIMGFRAVVVVGNGAGKVGGAAPGFVDPPPSLPS